MPTFTITAISFDERKKANADPNYSPKEYVLTHLQATDYKSACRKVRDFIAQGMLPQSAQVQESQ
jgi:hypothetical protein